VAAHLARLTTSLELVRFVLRAETWGPFVAAMGRIGVD
jgi:hypothetical protein